MIVLGINVDVELQHSWERWLAPEVQPFFVESLRSWPKGADAGPLSPELRDTYKVWKLDRSLKVLWLDEGGFLGMSREKRALLVKYQVAHGRGAVPSVRGWLDALDETTLRAQADGHRFVWWPSLLAGKSGEILRRTVEADILPWSSRYTRSFDPSSRHQQVSASTWNRCAGLLPAARSLAGTFPSASGANCFGTVMAAAGVEGAADEWMLQEPFLEWLDSACRPGSRDDQPGTVLVWRDQSGLPVHAAVTIGGGWALEKASQAWSSPRAVLTVEDAIRTNRSVGQRLERHHIA